MKLVVFGNSSFASLAWYFLNADSPYEVVAFTVDAHYLTADSLHGIPVVDFSTVERRFPPADHAMLLPVGPVAMNALRAERCEQARRKGYRLARYVSSRALTWPDLRLGENGIMNEGAIVLSFATLGEDVIVLSGAHVSHRTMRGRSLFYRRGCLAGWQRAGRAALLHRSQRDDMRRNHRRRGLLHRRRCRCGRRYEPDGVYVSVPTRRAARPASQLAAI